MRLATLAAVHAQRTQVLAMMQPRTSGPAPWVFTGTSALVSDGLAGSYAEAATPAAARVVFPGGGVGPFTLSGWFSRLGLLYIGGINTKLTIGFSSFGEQDVSCDLRSIPSGGGFYSASGGGPGPDLVHIAMTHDGALPRLYIGGSEVVGFGSESAWVADQQDALILFARAYDLIGNVAGSVRSLAEYDIAFSAFGVADLEAGGPDMNLLAYSGETTTEHDAPVHWWPALGDTGGVVIDRGRVGGCDLVLHGGVVLDGGK